MRNFYTFLLALFICAYGYAQLNSGDIAFTAFNADGDDDFAIVALVDIPANTIIYFTDNEAGTATSLNNTFEGIISWDTGNSIISAGTIVVFTDMDSDTNTNFGASIGSLTTESANFNIAAGGDVIYAYQGSSPTVITSWLAGIQNEVNSEGNLAATGLVAGSTFINFFTSGNPDGGYYNGNRDSESTFADYLNLLGDNSNWVIDDFMGENILPISTTPFTLGSTNDSDTEVYAPTPQVAATTIIAANVTTLANAEDVFGFFIEDQGSGDGLDTNVTTMRFVPGANNTADWTDHIQGITLTDENLTIYTPTVTISDTEITLDFSTPITIGDGTALEFLLGFYLNTTNIIDGSIIQFQIDEASSGFAANTSGSTFANPFLLGDIIGNNITIDVDVTQLAFIQQPPTSVLVNTPMTDVILQGQDVNGNLDTAYNLDVNITSSGTLTASPITVTAVNGIATFTGITHTATGTGLVLTADDTLFPSVNSNVFNIDLASVIPQLIITEIMQNPNDVIDVNGEYFEVFNPTNNVIDMNGWVISDNGLDTHTISSSVLVPAFGFAVLGTNSDPSTNGGVTINYQYDTIILANGNDEIVLTDNNFNEIDRVEYDNGLTFPDPDGAAMIFIGNDTDDNNIGSFWSTATVAEGINVDFGSPGSNGTGQVVAYLIFSGGSWNTVPSISTGSRIALIESNESTNFASDVNLSQLIIKEGADLTIDSGTTLTATDITLKSTSSNFSSLILDGTISGTVNYERFVNQIGTGAPGNGGNDLISVPLTDFTQNYQTFLSLGTPQNRDILAANGANTVHAFGPYDNENLQYVNYPTYNPLDPPSPTAEALIVGKGYRAATTSGANITFTGDVLSTNVTVGVSRPAAGSQWNLIGNPYTSFVDAKKFIEANTALFDPSAVAIYAYNSNTYTGGAQTNGNFTVINLASIDLFTDENFNVAPGQGFFIATDNTAGFSGTAVFNTGPTATEDMRTNSGTDDYILGRSSNTNNHMLKLALISTTESTTSFYFNDNSTLGLDLGYDAAVFGENANNFPIYSHLVQDNSGKAMAIQSIGNNNLTDVSIPLGVNANQGTQITFNINMSTLPSTVNIYLEDNVTNTITLLNNGDYTITPNINLSGTGRFFLRFTNNTLSTIQNTFDAVSIYANSNAKVIVIDGQLTINTTANVYDVQGRLITSTALNTSSRSQTVNINNVSSGVYVVQLTNGTQSKTQKVIIN